MSRKMDFSEKVKLEVKHRAVFQCCRCKTNGVDVHHIIPIKDGGTNDISNAAPLCKNCHDQLGDNPSKRTEIKQMRDYWYETVERMYSNKTDSLFPLIEKINDKLINIQTNQTKNNTELSNMKQMLKEVSNKAIDNMTYGTANLTVSNVIGASSASLSNININDLIRTSSTPKLLMTCPHCETSISITSIEERCPHCGAILY